VDEVLALRDAFQTIEYPAMLHCKSGADRAGLAAALYRHFHLGEPIEKLTELSWRYGHFQFGNTGRLDYFFEAYLAAHRPGRSSSWTGCRTSTIPEALQAEYDQRRKSRLGIWFVDKVLRRE
jgi:protein tyrosine/serine phosphatase